MRYQAEGDRQAASGFQSAADLSRMNAEYATQSTELQKVAALRASTLAIGGQQADVASAGVSGGSAQYLLMASQEQAALTQHMLDTQGRINVDAYMEQTQAYITQSQQQETSAKVADTAALSAEESAKAADEAAKGNEYAGLIQGVVGIAKIGAMFLGAPIR